MNHNVEILAPAGSMESLIAAVRCGANAVYLGVSDFNARRNASNFTYDELKTAVEYCHVRGVKVYVTLNTLISDAEMDDVLKLIKCVCAYGADAFIIQDLGIARIVKTVAPDMPIHASTQMSVMTPAGFKELETLGFTRAVLPRELSIAEIEQIRRETNIELEMFIHGALCMCVSGQCYLSAMLGGRSGNRGLCAGPCRLPFSAPSGTGYDLSLKDLCLIDRIPELAALGIASFKIEGRMKRPEYVAAAVTACKNSLAGKRDDALTGNLQAVFSRSGFTDGYLAGELGRKMFGTRGKDDVTAAAPALKELSKIYEKEPQKIGISIGLKAELGKPLLATATNGRIRVFVTSNYKVQRALTHATEVSSIRTQLKKCGGTPFDVKMTDIDVDENINIPLSEMNNIRRSVLAALEHKLCDGYAKEYLDSESLQIAEKIRNADTVQSHCRTNPIIAKKTIIRFSSTEQIPDAILQYEVDKIIVPLQTPEDKFSKLRKIGIPFGIEIPRALYGSLRKIDKSIENAIKSGASFAYTGTLDGIELAKKHGLYIIGGFTLNAYNSYAIFALEELGVSEMIASTELRISDINKLNAQIPLGICAYGRIPLMLTRNCPIRNGMDCKSCGKKQSLTDRKGIQFPVVCTNGSAEILNSCPIYLADKREDFRGLDSVLLYFTTETKNKVDIILKNYENADPPVGTFTRGLYYRGVE